MFAAPNGDRMQNGQFLFRRISSKLPLITLLSLEIEILDEVFNFLNSFKTKVVIFLCMGCLAFDLVE